MPKPTSLRVRFTLVSILALLGVGFALSPAYSQRGGIGGGGIGGGGIGGRGVGGGIGGVPRVGVPGGGMGVRPPSFPGGGRVVIPGQTVTVWRCPSCGYTQGSPGTCPRCSGSSFVQWGGDDYDSDGGSSAYQAGQVVGIVVGVLLLVGVVVVLVKAFGGGGTNSYKAYRQRYYGGN
jgi:hypothetical protein